MYFFDRIYVGLFRMEVHQSSKWSAQVEYDHWAESWGLQHTNHEAFVQQIPFPEWEKDIFIVYVCFGRWNQDADFGWGVLCFANRAFLVLFLHESDISAQFQFILLRDLNSSIWFHCRNRQTNFLNFRVPFAKFLFWDLHEDFFLKGFETGWGHTPTLSAPAPVVQVGFCHSHCLAMLSSECE